jgi:hypothetical protein
VNTSPSLLRNLVARSVTSSTMPTKSLDMPEIAS